MSKLASLAKDTAIYGLSSIIGRFLNYLLVPLYTNYISAASGGYGVITNIYGYTAIILVLLTFGMETTFFRFANKDTENARTAYSTTLFFVGGLSLLFFLLVLVLLGPISSAINYADHTEWVWVMALTVAIDATKCIPFDYLRYKNKALKFAALQLLNILLTSSISLSWTATMSAMCSISTSSAPSSSRWHSTARLPMPSVARESFSTPTCCVACSAIRGPYSCSE